MSTANPNHPTSPTPPKGPLHDVGHFLGNAVGSVRSGFLDLMGVVQTGMADLAAGLKAGYAKAEPAIQAKEQTLLVDTKAVNKQVLMDIVPTELPKAKAEAKAVVNTAIDGVAAIADAAISSAMPVVGVMDSDAKAAMDPIVNNEVAVIARKIEGQP